MNKKDQKIKSNKKQTHMDHKVLGNTNAQQELMMVIFKMDQ